MTLDRPAALSIAVVDRRGSRTLDRPADRVHDVPLVGFGPGDHVEVTVTAADAHGETAATTSFDTGPLPDGFPTLDVLVHDPARVEPGFTVVELAQVAHPDRVSWLAAIDDQAEVRWVW
ncbi:MAG: hypothetical protein ABMB14_14520, partial [Myxococcota bacterium]